MVESSHSKYLPASPDMKVTASYDMTPRRLQIRFACHLAKIFSLSFRHFFMSIGVSFLVEYSYNLTVQ